MNLIQGHRLSVLQDPDSQVQEALNGTVQKGHHPQGAASSHCTHPINSGREEAQSRRS